MHEGSVFDTVILPAQFYNKRKKLGNNQTASNVLLRRSLTFTKAPPGAGLFCNRNRGRTEVFPTSVSGRTEPFASFAL